VDAPLARRFDFRLSAASL